MKTWRSKLLTVVGMLMLAFLSINATFNMNKASGKIGNTLATDINTAIGGGSITIYSGSLNGASGSAPTGLLATIPIPAAGGNTITAPDTSGVTIALGSMAGVNPSANGTAATCRLLTSGGVCVFEGDVALSSAAINLNALGLQTSGTLTISSFVITIPGT